MKIQALIPKKADEPAKYFVEMTEAELDKVTGVEGLVHISGRYKVGAVVVLSKIYSKLADLHASQQQLKDAETNLRKAADNIKNISDTLPQE